MNFELQSGEVRVAAQMYRIHVLSSPNLNIYFLYSLLAGKTSRVR